MLMHSMRSKNTETPQNNAPNPFAEQPRRRLSNKNKVWFIVAGAVILLGVGTWLAWPTLSGFFGNTKNDTETPQQVIEVDEETKRYIAVQDEATDIVAEEGREAAREFVDEKIASVESDEEKAMLLIYKGTLSSDIPGAPIEYAQQAEDLSPSYTSASALATYYELEGDNANAIKYYKLMLERATPDFAEQFPDDYATINKKINYLESL